MNDFNVFIAWSAILVGSFVVGLTIMDVLYKLLF